MAWQKKAKKEIAEGWDWMREQNPGAADAAADWAKENKEEMKEVDRILYRSDEQFYGKTVTLDPQAVEAAEHTGGYPDSEGFLPEDARDSIYNDNAWYLCDEYLPDEFKGDAALHLPKDIIAGLQGLTELQREVIFRNVVNGEDVTTIAEAKNCSTRNIRDVRSRALKALRTAATEGAEGTGYLNAALFILWSLLIIAAGYLLFVPDAVDMWMRTAVFIALPIVTVAAVCVIVHKLRNSPAKRLRDYWQRNERHDK